jgi:hypothetical protein
MEIKKIQTDKIGALLLDIDGKRFFSDYSVKYML